MATVDCYIAATPSQVFAVLSDGWYYSDWVVGTSHVRAVDEHWSTVGSRIHHAAGVWPLAMHDETVVDQVDPERLLVLTARGRPLGQARVVITLTAERSGTRDHDAGNPDSRTGTLAAQPRHRGPAHSAQHRIADPAQRTRRAAYAARRLTPTAGAHELGPERPAGALPTHRATARLVPVQLAGPAFGDGRPPRWRSGAVSR